MNNGVFYVTLYIITITEVMSSASMAESSASLDVDAFVFMHGAVHPPKLEPSGQTSGCYQYTLSGKPLPDNTKLCAPKILGKSYHATNIIDFINTLRNEWNTHPELHDPKSFSDFCLSELKTFEQKQVDLMEQEMEANDLMQIIELDDGHTKKRMERRLVLQGAIVSKMNIIWDQHDCSIKEKSYYVISGDSFKNCIMFFCKDIIPSKSLQDLDIEIRSIGKIRVWVSYNSETKLFKITFGKTKKYKFSFEDLNNIIRSVVTGFTGGLDFNLTLFDFSCCVALFQDKDLLGLNPQLLSSTMLSNSGVDGPKLVYGTIREYRQREWESQVKRLTHAPISSNGHADDGGSQNRILDSQPPVLSDVSPSPSHSPSPSPDRPPPSLVVNLIGCVGSFADFQYSKFESRRSSRSDSVSPGRSAGGGSGRSRLIKKVSRKRNTRRQRHTNRRLRVKGSRRRTPRKQK